jgi:hypothetical protein
VIARFSRARIVRVSGIIAIGGAVLVVCAPMALGVLTGWVIVGVGLALLAPTILGAAPQLAAKAAPGTAIAAVTTLGYLGSFTGPPLIGALAGLFTLSGAIGVVAVAAATAAALAPAALEPRSPATCGTHRGLFLLASAGSRAVRRPEPLMLAIVSASRPMLAYPLPGRLKIDNYPELLFHLRTCPPRDAYTPQGPVATAATSGPRVLARRQQCGGERRCRELAWQHGQELAMRIGDLVVHPVGDGTFMARPEYFGSHLRPGAYPEFLGAFAAASTLRDASGLFTSRPQAPTNCGPYQADPLETPGIDWFSANNNPVCCPPGLCHLEWKVKRT